jgi:hypothetical protein
MNNEQTEYIKSFLNKCKIFTTNFTDLHGMLVPREVLLDIENYKAVKDDILILKKIFNSSSLTSLQSTAEDTQIWPLLNLVRQILKAINFKMTPKRVSAGYSKDGKKLYKRMFIIERYNQTESSNLTDEVPLACDEGSNTSSMVGNDSLESDNSSTNGELSLSSN